MNRMLSQIREWLIEAVTERIGLKLLAMAVTLLLVTLVRFQEESERFFDVEVVPVLPDTDGSLTMTSGFPKTVRVRLAGPRSVINAMSPGDIPPIEVDLTGRRVGTSHYYFNSDQIEESLKGRSKKMQFVRVVRTTPESIQIKMEPLVTRQVPVKIKIEGKPSPGSEIAEQASVSPQKVQLVGPASSVRGIQYVETDSVVIDGIGVGNHEWTVSAIPIDSVSIRGAESLVVKVQIRWILAERIFHRLKVTVQGNGLEARFKPQEVSVALEGPKLKLEAMSADQIRPVVAVETDKPPALGTFFTGDVTVAWLPDGVKVVSIEPPSVRVSLLAGPSSKPADKKNNKAE
jgi:hypothetical protein